MSVKVQEYTPIVGKCMDMCPIKERVMREREGLLHKFEWADNLEAVSTSAIHNISTRNHRAPNSRARKTIRKGDARKVVKSFARSAAGLDKTSPDDLRPAQVLEQTVEYLYKEVLTTKRESFTFIYDFIFDRLRSVRQDLVIQRIVDVSAIRILESMVRFHVYAAYRCRHEPVSKFDPHINRKHGIDNLKRLLWLYEVNDYWEKTRNEFEALYLIICPNSYEVYNRAIDIRLHDSFRNDELYNCVMDMCLSYQFNNYYKYFLNAKTLPPLLASASFEHARSIRGKAYSTLSMAFGASTCKFPVAKLQSVLLYPTVSQVEEDLRSLSVQIRAGGAGNNEKHAVFVKATNFNSSQLALLNYDLEPLSKERSLFDPGEIQTAAELIWPTLKQIPKDSQKKRDWFGNSSSEAESN